MLALVQSFFDSRIRDELQESGDPYRAPKIQDLTNVSGIAAR
jgi:hypothetical protein